MLNWVIIKRKEKAQQGTINSISVQYSQIQESFTVISISQKGWLQAINYDSSDQQRCVWNTDIKEHKKLTAIKIKLNNNFGANVLQELHFSLPPTCGCAENGKTVYYLLLNDPKPLNENCSFYFSKNVLW